MTIVWIPLTTGVAIVYVSFPETGLKDAPSPEIVFPSTRSRMLDVSTVAPTYGNMYAESVGVDVVCTGSRWLGST